MFLKIGQNVEARAAADAVERVALLGVGQQFGAAIVEQDDVELLRSVDFAGLARSAVKRVVTGKGLPGAGGGEHGRRGRGRPVSAALFDAMMAT